jgi:hypothetical protein
VWRRDGVTPPEPQSKHFTPTCIPSKIASARYWGPSGLCACRGSGGSRVAKFFRGYLNANRPGGESL